MITRSWNAVAAHAPAMPDEGQRLERFWLQLAGAVICVASGVRLAWLLAWRVPLGLDGYYYVLQVRSILTRGTPHFSTPFALPHYLLAVPAFVAGDPVTGLKIGTAIVGALLAMSAGLLVWRLSGRAFWALTASASVSVSSLNQAFCTEFIANYVGLLACAGLLLALERRTRSADRLRSNLLVLLAIIACVATHRSAALVAVLTVGAYAIAARWHGRRVLLLAIVGTATVTIVLALADRVRAGLPPLLQWLLADLGRWPMPRLGDGLFRAEAAALAIALPLLAIARRRDAEATNWSLVGALACVAAVLVLNPWATYGQGLGGIPGRLGLWGLLFVPIVVAIALETVSRGTGASWRAAAAVLAILAPFGGVVSHRLPGAAHPAYLRDRLELLAQASAIAAWYPQAPPLSPITVSSTCSRMPPACRPPPTRPASRPTAGIATGWSAVMQAAASRFPSTVSSNCTAGSSCARTCWSTGCGRSAPASW